MAIDFGCTRLLNPLSPPRFSPWPSAVSIALTARCQLHCRHCGNDSGPEHGAVLELALIEGALAELQAWDVKQVRLSGGEPTLHPQLDEILDACRRRAISVSLHTHGVLADSIVARLLASPIASFQVSLDGLETGHEKIRGKGSFAASLNSCRRLRGAGRSLTIVCHVGRHNLADVTGLAAVAAGLGADLQLSPLRPVGLARAALADVLPQAHDYLRVVSEVSALRQAHPRIRILTDFDIIDPEQTEFAAAAAAAACSAGRSQVSIAANGDVYPCAFFATPDHRFCAGNLHRESLEEIWRSSPVFEPFRLHSKALECQACAHYRQRCSGGCPATAHFHGGALDALDPTCFARFLADDSGRRTSEPAA